MDTAVSVQLAYDTEAKAILLLMSTLLPSVLS